jgi:hypothetical protein
MEVASPLSIFPEQETTAKIPVFEKIAGEGKKYSVRRKIEPRYVLGPDLASVLTNFNNTPQSQR